MRAQLRDRIPSSTSIAALALSIAAVAACSASGSGGSTPGGSTAGVLGVTPMSAFEATGQVGGPFSETRTYVLRNTGGEALEWGLILEAGWVSASSTAGSLAAGDRVDVEVAVDASVAASLAAGDHSGLMRFVDETAGTVAAELGATLHVVAAAGHLAVTPMGAFEVGGPQGGPFVPGSAVFTLSNTGGSSLAWSASTDAPWVGFSAVAGELGPGAQAQVVAAVNQSFAANLVPDAYPGFLRFRDETAGVVASESTVVLQVEPAAGALSVAPPGGFEASGPAGGPFTPASFIYTLANTGGSSLAWSASTTGGWASVVPASGSLAPGAQVQVVVQVTPAAAALAAGDHAGALDVHDPSNGALLAHRQGMLSVGGASGMLAVTPTDPFEVGGPVGGPFDPMTRTFTLSNTGGAAVSWTATSSAAWLGISPTGGSLAAGAQVQVVASVDPGIAGGLPAGAHAGQITFTDHTNGSPAQSVPAYLGIGTTIANQSWLEVHGRPFLPIMVWNQPPWATSVTYLKGLGVNTYLNNGLNPPEPTNGQLLDLLAAEDMWAVLKFDVNVMDHPRVLGWLLPDEPDQYDVPPATVQQQYNAVRAADPDHFIGLNLTAQFFYDSVWGNPSLDGLYQQYTDIPDIASFDLYPVTGWNQPSWVYRPGAATAFLREHYVDEAKPVWAIVEASDQRLSWTPPSTPGPTPAQMRFEVWDCVIHGATGIGYFTIAFNPFEWANLTPAIEQEMARTNGQLTALTPVLLSTPPAINISSSEASGKAHNFTVRQSGSTYWVFADNADMGYGSETITFTFPQPISSVTVYDEGRTINPNGSSFTDSFSPLQVHVYEVQL